MSKIILSLRQKKIIEIVKENGTITGTSIGKMLNVTRAALRSDLAILIMLGIIDARPKVGYFYLGKKNINFIANEIKKIKVKSVMSVPVVVSSTNKVSDVIISMFTEDVGTIFVVEQEFLVGVISRKDLLRATLGDNNLKDLPVKMVMTPVSKIIYTQIDEDVIISAKKMIDFEIDCLPVVERNIINNKKLFKIIGRISKTTITKIFIDLGMGRW